MGEMKKPRRQAMTIVRDAEVKFLERSPGIMIRQLVNRESGAKATIMGDVIMEPGTSLDYHRHSVEEAMIITEGTATLVINDETSTLGVGDAVLAPAGSDHLLANKGQQRMRFQYFYPTISIDRHPATRKL
jgi:quercetin dioxygenase-like cupin family protein